MLNIVMLNISLQNVEEREYSNLIIKTFDFNVVSVSVGTCVDRL